MKLVLALVLAVVAVASAADKYSVEDIVNGAFIVDDVNMEVNQPHFGAGAVATVTVSGHINNKRIIAGTAKYEIYEGYIPKFIASGNHPYFECTQYGCDPTKPVALVIADVSNFSSKFTLTSTFTMPAIQGQGDNSFKMVLWGQDQDHYPYDFSLSVLYNITSTGAKVAIAAPSAPASDPYQVKNIVNGAFTVGSVEMTDSTGKWTAGAVATVKVSGTVDKRIIAGTAKYEVYEGYIPKFIASGNHPYFECNQYGCDPTKPVALVLSDPTADKSDFVLTSTFTLPAVQGQGDNAFHLVLWGQDQDHYPYDFSLSVFYNTTSSSFTMN